MWSVIILTFEMTIQIVFIILCIIMSGFFSSSETALTSVGKIKARQLKKEKKKNAGILEKLLDRPKTFITAILIGNNIVNIAASSVSTVLFVSLVGNNGIVLSTIIMTLLVLVFGEITPKSLAQENPERISLAFAKPIFMLTIIFKPLIMILNKLTTGIIHIFAPSIGDKPLITEEEFENILSVSDEQGLLEEEETEIIRNVLQFGECQALDVMTPRTNIVSIDVNISKSELKEVLSQDVVFSRLPVYENSIDDIIGILHVKDLVANLFNYEEGDIRPFLKEAFYAYEYMPIIDLFKQMKSKNVSLAIIIDEYGGTSGVVSIEDIIEELVGEIDDEYDQYNKIKVAGHHVYFVDPTLKIDDFNQHFHQNLHSDKFESIGGFVIGLLDRMPKNKDTLRFKNIEFVVEKVEQRRITKLRVIFH